MSAWFSVMKIALMEVLKLSNLPVMFPFAILVTNTSPAMHPETASCPAVLRTEIYYLWNSTPEALRISPVLGVMILSLF